MSRERILYRGKNADYFAKMGRKIDAPVDGLTRSQIHDIGVDAHIIASRIYWQIRNIWLNVRDSPTSYPHKDVFSPIEKWTRRERERLKEVGSRLDLELLIYVLHSQDFVEVLRGADRPAENYRRQTLISIVEEKSESVMAYALSRTTPVLNWFKFYNDSAIAALLGKFTPPPDRMTALAAKHPFEIYLATNGKARRSFFKPKKLQEVPMVNIDQNSYVLKNFEVRPARKPRMWPEGEAFPSDPSDFLRQRSSGPWPECYNCQGKTGNGFRCDCAMQWQNHPPVEIVQYMYGKGLNRGVRALEDIRDGQVIGEYAGVFIPRGQQDKPPWREEDYAFEWDSPSRVDRTGGQKNDQGEREPIASVVAGRQGSWARFLNQANNEGEENAEIFNVAWGRKHRLVVFACANIAAGQEVRVTYGAEYGTIQKTKKR